MSPWGLNFCHCASVALRVRSIRVLKPTLTVQLRQSLKDLWLNILSHCSNRFHSLKYHSLPHKLLATLQSRSVCSLGATAIDHSLRKHCATHWRSSQPASWLLAFFDAHQDQILLKADLKASAERLLVNTYNCLIALFSSPQDDGRLGLEICRGPAQFTANGTRH